MHMKRTTDSKAKAQRMLVPGIRVGWHWYATYTLTAVSLALSLLDVTDVLHVAGWLRASACAYWGAFVSSFALDALARRRARTGSDRRP